MISRSWWFCSTQSATADASAAAQCPASGSAKGSAAIALLVAITAACGIAWSRTELKKLPAPAQADEALYLPSVDKVRLVTLGFDNMAGDLFWFDTINYFGKHFQHDNIYTWLAHRCELVTDLDPKARHAYEFCATMLAWIAKQPEVSAKLLTKAIEHEPGYWRYHYLRGFTNWYFLDNRELAASDLATAAQLPGTPPFVGGLASRLLSDGQSPEAAIGFLKELISKAQDSNSKRALEEKLNLAFISVHLKALNEKLQQFETQTGRKAATFDELVQAKLLPGRPVDPFGDPYAIDPATGAASTSSGRKGLQFTGKTKETGLAKSVYAK